MLHALARYYGLDLFATVISLTAIYLLGNKSRQGFLLGIFGNVVWIIVGFWSQSAGIILANVIFIRLNTRGYWNWGQNGTGDDRD